MNEYQDQLCRWLRAAVYCRCESSGDASGNCVACLAANELERLSRELHNATETLRLANAQRDEFHAENSRMKMVDRLYWWLVRRGWKFRE